jgi:hypothetical protein
MTVGELIKILKRFPNDLQVVIEDADTLYTGTDIHINFWEHAIEFCINYEEMHHSFQFGKLIKEGVKKCPGTSQSAKNISELKPSKINKVEYLIAEIPLTIPDGQMIAENICNAHNSEMEKAQ